MNIKKNWVQYNKIETIALSLILYGVILVYVYQFFQVAGKYEPWTTDEFFYYTEAKAISAYNTYQTPASLDGNTSYIGDFGFHGVSYALKDGWLAKLFFNAQDPPLVWNNFLTCLATVALILLFNPFSLNVRLKIALVVATHYILFSSTFSYMQETIHYFFAVIALWYLYMLYEEPLKIPRKHLYFFLLIVITATTFRYGWFIWGLGLLPMATNIKSFLKWALIAICLLIFGLFISRYIAAPYPYDEMVADRIIRSEKFSLINSIQIVVDKFTENIKTFLTPAENISTTCMRYLLLFLLLINTFYAVKKRSRFTIACAFIGWGYFFAGLSFYHVHWGYDERALAVLTPLLAFSLIGNSNSLLFYPAIAVQLWLLPGVATETNSRNRIAISSNALTQERLDRENSYAKIKDLVTDENAVIGLDVSFVLHGNPNYFIDFPLVNSKGNQLHYRIYIQGNDLRRKHLQNYLLNTNPAPSSAQNLQLIYSDKWMYLYKVLY